MKGPGMRKERQSVWEVVIIAAIFALMAFAIYVDRTAEPVPIDPRLTEQP